VRYTIMPMTESSTTTITAVERAELEESGAATRGTSRPGLILALVLVGQFMALLDVAVVNVAAPSIETELGSSGAALQLVVSGYTIAYAVLLITGARLGERLGFSRVFLAGLGLFTAASLACALAPTTSSLIGFRIVQGVGSALMVPQVISLIQRTFTRAARVKALGAYTATLSSGMVVGQVLGGVLVSADAFGIGWRSVFAINVPIGVVLLAAGGRLLPRFAGTPRQLDLAGLLTLSAAVFLLVVPLVMGHQEHWPIWGWVMLSASIVAVASFVLFERGLARRGGHPLIRGRVLTSPGLAVAAVAMLLVMAGVAGFMFSFTLYLQGVLGQSALRTGLTFAPMAAGFGVAGLWWRTLPEAWHQYLPTTGLVACALGYGVLGGWVASGRDVPLGLELVMVVMGLLAGCAYGQLFASALSRVRVQDAADASGVMVTVLQLGQVVGVATFGTLFLTALTIHPTAADGGHAAALAVIGIATATGAAGLLAAFRPRAGPV
jgi:MFS family permease